MAIYDFFLSRNGAASTSANYVGHVGRLFYDDVNGVIRLSDGVTPGGTPLPVTIATDTKAGAVKPNGSFSLNPVDGTLGLLVATETRIGGLRLGPGVTTNAQGQLIVDSEGLDFSFGNFAAIIGEYAPGAIKEGESYALLQSIEENEDVVIASNGTGSVNLVGEFRIYPTNETIDDALIGISGFRVTADGQVRIIAANVTNLSGGVQIVGNAAATQQDPINTGVMLHITGQDGDEARSYVDAVGGYAGFVGRRMNGTASSPTGVLADQEVTRFAANVYASDEGFGERGVGQLRWYASENITSTNKGGRAEFWITPVGQAVTQKIVSFDGSGITMAEGKTITGNVTGNVTGNAGTVTNGVYTTDTATVTNTMLAGSIANNKLANSTISGVALGSNLAALSAGSYLTGTDYNGSTARTFAVDATTTNTASKVVARDANGDIFANLVNDSKGDVRSVPINDQSGAYNLAATDNGKMISITTGGVSVLQNVFASPYGQIVSIFNNSNSSQTITQGAGVTLRLAGTAATGNRTLARYGVATLTCVAANTFVISGAGLT